MPEWAVTISLRKQIKEMSIRVLGVSGSIRKASRNTGLLRAAADAAAGGKMVVAGKPVEFTMARIDDLPLYNQDLDVSDPAAAPLPVQRFRAEVAAADAYLFACPEHNYGMTAALKNALDWASKVPGNQWKGKAGGIVGAGGGTGTARAQMALRQSCVHLDITLNNAPEVIQNRFTAQRVFDEATGDVTGEELRKRVTVMLERTAKLAVGLKAAKEL